MGKIVQPLPLHPIYLHLGRRGRDGDGHRRGPLFPLQPRHPAQLSEYADHRGRIVRAGLRLHVVVAAVPEPVAPVRPADDRADEQIGVGAPPAEPVVEPLRAADELPAVLVRHDGRGAVVHPAGVPGAVADEVAGAPGVGAQHVVRLRPGEREHLLGRRRARHGPGGAAGLGGRQVVGVGGEKERGAGHVLHVVPLPDVEHPAGAALHVGVRAALRVPAQARAHVPLRLGPVPLQRAPVARRVLPSQQQLKQAVRMHASISPARPRLFTRCWQLALLRAPTLTLAARIWTPAYLTSQLNSLMAQPVPPKLSALSTT
jgi:hypothetical protein